MLPPAVPGVRQVAEVDGGGFREAYIIAVALEGRGKLEVRHTYNGEVGMRKTKSECTKRALVNEERWPLLSFSRSGVPACASYHVGGGAMTNLLEYLQVIQKRRASSECECVLSGRSMGNQF